MTCSSTRRRISVMAFGAATPRICVRPHDVTACTTLAPAAIQARTGSSSGCFFPMTSSMRYFGSRGTTTPASRLMSISSSPTESRPRRAQMSARASSHAADQRIFFFLGSSGTGRATSSLSHGLDEAFQCRCRDRPGVRGAIVAVAQDDDAEARRAVHERRRVIAGRRSAVTEHHHIAAARDLEADAVAGGHGGVVIERAVVVGGLRLFHADAVWLEGEVIGQKLGTV